MQLTLFDDATDCPTQLYCGKTSPAFYQHETTPSDVFWQLCLASPKSLSQQGIDGRVQVLCVPSNTKSHGEYWTPNISESPNAAEECFLLQVIETDVLPKYYLSNQAKAGILNRAKKKGKESAAFIESSFGTYRKSDVGGTVKRTGGALSGGSETLVVNIGATLSTGFGGRGVDSDQICNGNCVINYPKVRKLTPIECERLQGFPDNYTKISWRGKTAEQCPDTPRYMAIGNSMAVPVIHWLGNRIILKDKQKDIS